MKNIFDLPEVLGDAVFGPAVSIFYSSGVWIGTLSMNYSEVSSVTYTFDKSNGSFMFHAWFKNGNILDIPLMVTRASEFEDWLKHHGMKISEDSGAVAGPNSYNVGPARMVNSPTLDMDFVKKSPAPVECPVCYGTGYHKGFGGPCSSGCRPGR